MRPKLSAAGMICDFARVYDTPRKAESRVKSHFTAFSATRRVAAASHLHSLCGV